MLIRCPNCKVSYDVGTAVIPEEGKKVRCSQCGETWMCTPADLFEAPILENIKRKDSDSQELPEGDSVTDVLSQISAAMQLEEETPTAEVVEEPQQEAVDEEIVEEVTVSEPIAEAPIAEVKTEKEAEEADDKDIENVPETDKPQEAGELKADASLKPDTSKEMQEIFARLESQTETLFQIEKNMPPHKKIYLALVRNLGLQRKKNRRLYSLIILVLMFLSLFYLRYDIVRMAPVMEKFYEACGIDCVIAGEGLEFQNITRMDFEEDYVGKMEIRGFIANITNRTIEIPTIQVEMLDKNGQALQYLYQEPPVKRITPASRVAFRIVVNKPSTFTKFVYLTFTNEHPEGTIKALNVDPRDE